MTCQMCGLHELQYDVCDRWDCPRRTTPEEIESPADESDHFIAIGLPAAEYGDWGICDIEHFFATGEIVLIGTMTKVERECRDAWALADPKTPTWTVSRFNRITPPWACSQCGKYPCECDDC